MLGSIPREAAEQYRHPRVAEQKFAREHGEGEYQQEYQRTVQRVVGDDGEQKCKQKARGDARHRP